MKIETSLSPAALPVINSTNMQKEIIPQIFDQVLGVNRSKGGEYSGAKNALANFERLSRDMGMLPEKVLWVYLTKHLDSIRTYINNLDHAIDGQDHLYLDLPKLSEPITGRIMDVVAYMCLLTAQCHRRDLQQQWLDQTAEGKPDELVGRKELRMGADSVLGFDAAGHTTVSVKEVNVQGQVVTVKPVTAQTVGQINTQPHALVPGTAQYRQLVRLLFNAKGDHVRHDPQNPPDSWKRYMIVAQLTDLIVVMVSEDGQVVSHDLIANPIDMYSLNGTYSELPVYGAQYARGKLTSILSQGGWDFLSAVLATGDEHSQLLVDLDKLAVEAQ